MSGRAARRGAKSRRRPSSVRRSTVSATAVLEPADLQRSANTTVPGLADRLLPGRDTQLAVDMPGMGLHGVVGDEHLAGDLPQGKVTAEPAQDLLLAATQRLGQPAKDRAGHPGPR